MGSFASAGMRSSCTSYLPGPKPDLNPLWPDPDKYDISWVTEFKNCFVSKIIYPNCKNFEGQKILVTSYDPRDKISIDPHFDNESGLIARFEPSPKGIGLALALGEVV